MKETSKMKNGKMKDELVETKTKRKHRSESTISMSPKKDETKPMIEDVSPVKVRNIYLILL